MLGRLIPREVKFFDLFREISTQILAGAKELEVMLGDLAHAERHARTIKEIEHRADEITHRTLSLLHQTFITPLDRDDIHQLIKSMDDIIDFLEAASQRIWLFDIKPATPEAKQLAQLCTRSAECIQQAVSRLDNLKQPESIIALCVELNRLENEADNALRAALAKLFKEEQDAKQLIKLKELYEYLETVTDRCEDVANIIEGIVLEYA